MQKEQEALERFVVSKHVISKKKKFNTAYQWLYCGMGELKGCNYISGILCLQKAVCLDGEIIKFAAKKVSHQIRKRRMVYR